MKRLLIAGVVGIMIVGCQSTPVKDSSGTPVVKPEPASPQVPASTNKKETSPTALAAAAAPAGIVGIGFTLDEAVLFALLAAYQQQGEPAVDVSVIRQAMMLQWITYQLVEQKHENGVYIVRVAMVWPAQVVEKVQRFPKSVLVGGREIMEVDGKKEGASLARSAVAEALAAQGYSVTTDEGETGGAAALAQKAKANGQSTAVWLDARATQRDKLGQFYSYRCEVGYQIVSAVTGQTIGSGRQEGMNSERPLSAREAAEQALREVAAAIPGQVLSKLPRESALLAAHHVYVIGVDSQTKSDGLVTKFRGLPGVQEAQVSQQAGGVVIFILKVKPEAIPEVPKKIQELFAGDFKVLQSQPYCTLAKCP
jgi:hypothetical protein